MTTRTVLTVAALTLQEASRRRVLRALAGLTVLLLALSAWGFSRLAGVDSQAGALTTGETRFAGALLLNLVMFGISLVAALGTAFLAGPTLAGEVESGLALAVLARPVRRSTVVLGKWLGLVVFGGGFVVVAGLAEFLLVRLTVGYWPPRPLAGLALLVAQTAVLLTLGLLLSTVISPLASGIVAVGLFGTCWIAGVVGGVGAALGNEGVARVGVISRVLLPTDGLWRGAMNAIQDPTAIGEYGGDPQEFPFLGPAPLSTAYLGWVAVWVALVLALAIAAFRRRDV
jgi:ABC-type transport system involved in multi-copper enzyme maturation permease subunit